MNSTVNSTMNTTVNMTMNQSAVSALHCNGDDVKSREEVVDGDMTMNFNGINITDIQPEDDELDDSVIPTVGAKRKGSRKRSLFEYDGDFEMNDDSQPPLKRRRIQETRELIEHRGVDMFFRVLDDGTEKDQELLMDLVQKYQ